MNAVTNFMAIASILLALATAGGAVKQQAEVNSPATARDTTPSKIAINHNETMVSDAALVQQVDTLSDWLTSLQAFVFGRFVNTPADIAPSRIALNHNETMVSDAAMVQQADTSSEGLTSPQAFVFSRFLSYAPGVGRPGGCDDWGCGGNHNETFVEDAAPTRQIDDVGC